MILDWFDHFLKGKPSRYLEMAAQRGEKSEEEKSLKK
jgi:hypothetical protein